MAYSTQADIQKLLTPAQLVQLADDDGNGIADTAVLDEAIAQADATIDAYLASRIAVPISPVPAVVRSLSVDIAIWNIYSRRSIANELRKQRVDAAIAFLKAFADGKVTLGVTPAPAATEEGGPKATRAEGDRTFTIGRKTTGESGSLDNY